MNAAARIARRLTRKPHERRDPIAFLLFYKMDWCEKHPGLMFAGVVLGIVLVGALEQLP